MHPIIVSEVQDKKLSANVSTLAEVTDDGAVHRVRFSVSHASSADSAKCIKIREKSGELKPAPKGAVLKKGQELVTCMQMLVKDAASLSSNLFTRVGVIDSGIFFGQKPKDILADDNKFKECVQRLEQFNVWCEASVQKKNGQLVITDATALKKYE